MLLQIAAYAAYGILHNSLGGKYLVKHCFCLFGKFKTIAVVAYLLSDVADIKKTKVTL